MWKLIKGLVSGLLITLALNIYCSVYVGEISHEWITLGSVFAGTATMILAL